MTCDYKNLQTELALEDTGLIFFMAMFSFNEHSDDDTDLSGIQYIQN